MQSFVLNAVVLCACLLAYLCVSMIVCVCMFVCVSVLSRLGSCKMGEQKHDTSWCKFLQNAKLTLRLGGKSHHTWEGKTVTFETNEMHKKVKVGKFFWR